MRILVGWDRADELETIQSFLNIGVNTADCFAEPASFQEAFAARAYDVVLLALNFPSPAESFAYFQELRRAQPDAPVVGAWFTGQIHHLAKFILDGLHSYILRDGTGEFILLLTTALEAAHQSVLARRSQVLAEKLREEVESVRQLQESVIPNNLPQIYGYKVVARYEPSQIRVLGDRPVVMAGGDYYDMFRVGEKSMILMLGDAAGHGVKACMSIMTMHTLISMIRSHAYANTAEFVTEVNRRLCQSSIVAGEQGGFITLLYCSLDLEEHSLQWTSAGHPLPLLQDLDTGEIRALGTADQAGLPLVVADGWIYPSCMATLPPRCRVLLYSDGLEEAFPDDSQRHRQFGIQGIKQTLQATADQPIENVLDELFEASHRATEGAGRLDDTSIVLLERSS